MVTKLIWFGLVCVILASLVGIVRMAMGQQQLVCPSGTYLASDYKCYPQVASSNSSLATRLGSSIGHLIAPAFVALFAHSMGVEPTYNANGNITHICFVSGGPMYRYIVSKANLSTEQIAKIMDEKNLLCSH